MRQYYDSFSTANAEEPIVKDEGIGFDVEFVLFDETEKQSYPTCTVYVVELGGANRIGIVTGIVEATALERLLQGVTVPRPLTHAAMGAVIGQLGGELTSVVVDRFHPADQFYEAKLLIAQGSSKTRVDVRPSDAFILAVQCGVPILVERAVVHRGAR